METMRSKRTKVGAAFGAVLLGAALMAGGARAADDGPELDKQRVATCEARGGRLARNHEGQMLCKDAKVKLKDYLAQHPTAVPPAVATPAPVPPAPGVTAPPPVYAPASTGTHTAPAGPPQMPPPKPIDLPGGGLGAGGGGGTTGTGGGTPPLPPVMQPPTKTGGSCALRSCLYSSYSKTCQCQQFNSAELCQFKETTPGGKCADPSGMTTALCPAGYSCINNSCRKEPAC